MTSAAKVLLDKGAEVDSKNAYGTTALGFAARRGNVDLVDLLLESNPELVNRGDNSSVCCDELIILVFHNCNVLKIFNHCDRVESNQLKFLIRATNVSPYSKLLC